MSQDVPFLYSMNFYKFYLKDIKKLISYDYNISKIENIIKSFMSYYEGFKPLQNLTGYDIRKALKENILTLNSKINLYYYFNNIKKSKGKKPKYTLNLLKRLELGLISENDIKSLISENINLNFKNFNSEEFKINSRLQKTILNN